MKRLFAFLVVTCLCVPSVCASLYYFDVITSNTVNGSALESQLSVDVYANGIDAGTGNSIVAFKFVNDDSTGYLESVISEIYFDDGSLLTSATIINGTGVLYVPGANPPDLPGGGTIVPAFNATSAFSAQGANPAPQNGVGPGEEVVLNYVLQAGTNINNVLNELNNGTVRIGLHVIGIDCDPSEWGDDNLVADCSESYVNVPEPATLTLLGLSAFLIRKRRR